MRSDPEPAEYSDATFDSFAGASSYHGDEPRDADGNRVYTRPSPLTGVLILTLSLLGAYALFTPLPALVAAIVSERAHRRGERHMRWWFAFALACFAAGFWSMANLWNWLP
jgi:hypothetical protein